MAHKITCPKCKHTFKVGKDNAPQPGVNVLAVFLVIVCLGALLWLGVLAALGAI